MTTLAELLTAIEQHDTDYDTRYSLVLDALARAHHDGLVAGIGIDHISGPDMDGYRTVAYIELPTGQVSWHLPEHGRVWDGHTTAEKYLRTRAYAETEPAHLAAPDTWTTGAPDITSVKNWNRVRILPPVEPQLHLDRLRHGLFARGLYLQPDAPDQAVVTLALDTADGWKRERQRVDYMAHQRGEILELCAAATELNVDSPVFAGTMWTLDPAAVRAALIHQPTKPDEPMSRKEEILRTVLWQLEQVQAEAPDEFDLEDRAMIQLLRYAVDDLEAAWATALLELIGGGLDDMASDEMDAAIAKWKAATQSDPSASAAQADPGAMRGLPANVVIVDELAEVEGGGAGEVPVTDRDLTAIRARVEAATPGPWGVGHGTKIVRGYEPTGPSSYTCISAVAEVADEYEREMWDEDGERYVHVEPEADAAFIAHAREDIPALLAVVDRLTGERDEARAAVSTLGPGVVAARDAVYAEQTAHASTRAERDALREELAEARRALRQIADQTGPLDGHGLEYQIAVKALAAAVPAASEPEADRQAVVDEALNLIGHTARRQIRRGNTTALGMSPIEADREVTP